MCARAFVRVLRIDVVCHGLGERKCLCLCVSDRECVSASEMERKR